MIIIETFLCGKNKYYILGSNFGPYKTQKYFDNLYSVFSKAEDVCFREKYSYELFKTLPNVRYASDIVFNLDTKNIKNTNAKRVIFSIISCKYKMEEKYQKDYNEKIIEMIDFYIEKGYKICLMSFCREEKDEEAIEEILEKCPKTVKEKIEKYYYNGNLEEALNIIGDSRIIVASRFHANILGLLFGKNVITLSYSDKIKHVLSDMGLDSNIIDIKEIKNFNIKQNQKLLQDNFSSEVEIKVIEAINDAKRQFEKLDKILL